VHKFLQVVAVGTVLVGLSLGAHVGMSPSAHAEAVKALAIMVVECIDLPSGKVHMKPTTGRVEVQGSGPNCAAAQKDARTKAGDHNSLCRQRMGNNDFTTRSWSWQGTKSCPK
jgi:hypothetical protein